LSPNTAVRLIRVPQLAEAPYAYASTISASARFVFLAGACPIDENGLVVTLGDIAGQAQQCLDNLVAALAAAGALLTDVVWTRVLVASSEPADLAAAWAVVHERFGDHDVPSTLIGVAALGYAGQLVEIEATAGIVDDGSRTRPDGL
jgi:enamine deaminase RidA (YjgF/YER057c/UK114 family)